MNDQVREAAKKESMASKLVYAGNGRFSVVDVPVNSCAVERDAPEVERAIRNLNSIVDRYENLMFRLQDRLNCVVTPALPEVNEKQRTSIYSTVLAKSIEDTCFKLQDITDNLENLYDRIEL